MAAPIPLDPGIEMVVSSRGISKGLSQTDGPQFIPKAYVQVGSVQLGGQWKNVTSPTADGEGAAFVQVTRKLAGFQLTAGAAYKLQSGAARGADSDAFELSVGASRKLGRLSLKLNAIYSPDDLGSARQSLFVEAGPALDVTKTLRLSANVARRMRTDSPNYWAANIGATKTLVRGVGADLRYYRTSRASLGDAYHSRLVVSARLAL